MKLLLFIISMIISGGVYSQQDSVKMVKYTPGFRFKTGIYLAHSQLVNNRPIPLNRIITDYNKAGFDFFDKLLSDDKLYFYDDFGIKRVVETGKIWGFSRRGTIYINWGDDFNRIPVVGSLCHFIATVTVYEDNFYNPMYSYGYYSYPRSTSAHTEIFQYIMEFRSGKIMDYTEDNVLLAISGDKELYEEYKSLSKKKKKQLKFFYLRKYNEKHPLYIPVR